MQPEITAKIKQIEADAIEKGWPPEYLWNDDFWATPRGLATVLEIQDEITEVAIEYIGISRINGRPIVDGVRETRRVSLKFRRNGATGRQG
jgi:hypothetical protein